MKCASSGILPVTRHGQTAIEDFKNRVLKLNRGIVIALMCWYSVLRYITITNKHDIVDGAEQQKYSRYFVSETCLNDLKSHIFVFGYSVHNSAK